MCHSPLGSNLHPLDLVGGGGGGGGLTVFWIISDPLLNLIHHHKFQPPYLTLNTERIAIMMEKQ